MIKERYTDGSNYNCSFTSQKRERHEKIWQHFQMWQSWVTVTRQYTSTPYLSMVIDHYTTGHIISFRWQNLTVSSRQTSLDSFTYSTNSELIGCANICYPCTYSPKNDELHKALIQQLQNNFRYIWGFLNLLKALSSQIFNFLLSPENTDSWPTAHHNGL